MLLALGAASSAMDALQSLISSKSTSPQTTGFTQNPPTPFDTANGSTQTESPPPVTGGAGFTQISPETMSALIAAQSQSTGSTTSASTTSASTDPASALQDLFSQIDANGDGQISKTEFENALGAGGTNLAQADDVFNKLDANGDGSVSLDEMQKALQGAQGKGGHHHHHHVADSRRIDGTTERARPPARVRRRRIELRSVAAGAGRRNQHVGNQQRRFDHDIHHQCRRLRHHHDLARGDDIVEQRDGLLQFPRADDSARGAGGFLRRGLLAVAQRLNGFGEPIVASYPNRSRHAGSAPRKGSAVAS